MRRRLLLLAVVALAAVAASPAAAAVRWSSLAAGTTAPSGAQSPRGYLAVTRAGERRFAGRLDAKARRALARLDLRRSAAVAVFLDGAPCASKVAVTRLVRAGAVLTVHLSFTRPPIGVATCVRTSTPFVLLAAVRSSLGRTIPKRVEVDAVARP